MIPENMRNKIIYYSPTSTMGGETSESDAAKYRNWALKELQIKFPDFEIEVSDKENINLFWTDINDVQMNDKIESVVYNLWDYCPWVF